MDSSDICAQSGGKVWLPDSACEDAPSQSSYLAAGAVRRDGSYLYEEFLATGGTDVKVSIHGRAQTTAPDLWLPQGACVHCPGDRYGSTPGTSHASWSPVAMRVGDDLDTTYETNSAGSSD